ncbi:MAG: aminopeptidase P family protein, partial [Acidobacteria bacterium]|nr:aminopeptidase P family protein [Candidatus Sulfomarinibacter kjeldsenii]
CRLIKSKAEIDLMQRASDITIEVYRRVIPMLEPGMTANEFSDLTRKAHTALGASGSINAQIGKASSRPHGRSKRPIEDGDVVLMDGGCRVEGYKSDISRTVVIGEPTPRQQETWLLAAGAQAAAWEAIALGVPCEEVDAAARAFYEAAGFGPGYALPGCPHRTGHGIGLDGHECIHLVRGNTRPLEVGMCFSNEPLSRWACASATNRRSCCLRSSACGSRIASIWPRTAHTTSASRALQSISRVRKNCALGEP